MSQSVIRMGGNYERSIIYITNVLPCPWSKFVVGHRDSDATNSKVPSNAFLGDGIGRAHIWDIADVRRDTKSLSSQDILVSSWLREEFGNNRHELLAGFARLGVTREHDRAKARDRSTRSHVSRERPTVCIASDAFGTGARIGCVVRHPTFHGVLEARIVQRSR